MFIFNKTKKIKYDVERWNLVWSQKSKHIFTKEEYEKELAEHPDLWKSYGVADEIARRYNNGGLL